ncbi:MAG: hypothetical protein EOO24_59585, partial [Comamonadaceae bacterium]
MLLRFLLLVGLALCGNAATAADRTVRLEPGQQVAIPLGHRLARLAIGDDTVVDAQPLRGAGQDTAVLLRARNHGRTQLLLWATPGATPLAWDIEVASDVQGLRVEGRGSRLVTSGELPDLASHRRATAQVEAAARPPTGGAAATSGGATGTIVDQSVVRLPNTVQVDVKVVEFNRTDLKEAGINLVTSNRRGSFTFGVESQLAPLSAAFELAAGIIDRGNFNLG